MCKYNVQKFADDPFRARLQFMRQVSRDPASLQYLFSQLNTVQCKTKASRRIFSAASNQQVMVVWCGGGGGGGGYITTTHNRWKTSVVVVSTLAQHDISDPVITADRLKQYLFIYHF